MVIISYYNAYISNISKWKTYRLKNAKILNRTQQLYILAVFTEIKINNTEHLYCTFNIRTYIHAHNYRYIHIYFKSMYINIYIPFIYAKNLSFFLLLNYEQYGWILRTV